MVSIRDRRTILGLPLGQLGFGPPAKFPYQIAEINHRRAYLLDLSRGPKLIDSVLTTDGPLGYNICTRRLTHLAVQNAFDQDENTRVFGTFANNDGGILDPHLPQLDLRIIRFGQQPGFPVRSYALTPDIYTHGSPGNNFLTFNYPYG